MKNKKIIPITVSFIIVLICAGILIWLISVYNSHKTFEVITFKNNTALNGKVAKCDEIGYCYNEYGGNFEKSDLYSIPLSQYSGPDEDYLFYKFNSKYYGTTPEALPFNGGNDSIRFLYKHNKVLYLTNTDELTCTEISPEIEFHSASTGGTYLLEINGAKYNFYKRVNYAYDLYPAVPMLLKSDKLEFVSWINDRYALIKSYTDKGYIYVIADAETGETLTCMSIYNSDEEYKKEIISLRFFVKEYLENKFVVFDIYTQENIEFEYNSNEKVKVLSVSDNASYSVILDDSKTKIINRNGTSIDVSEIISGKFNYSEFILDNILFVSYNYNGKNVASVHKILF